MGNNLIIPILRILHEAKAKAFYVDYLGFKVDWEHRYQEDFPVYMQVGKDGWVIHLTEHAGDCEPGASIILNLDDVRGYHQELLAKKMGYKLPDCEETEWNTIEMGFKDPFGNQLNFNQNV